MLNYTFLIIFLVSGCTVVNPWKLESISTGEQSFDSARLLYSEINSPLRFEIVRLETGIEAFLNLAKYKFSSADDVKIEFSIAGQTFDETIPFLEGKMRIRFSQELTERLIQALQEGNEVVIMADGFEQHLHPENFIKQYEKLAGIKDFFRNPFKGIFDP